MIPDSIANRIQSLAADFVMIGQDSPTEDWNELCLEATVIRGEMEEAGLVNWADVIGLIETLCQHFVENDIHDRATANTHISNLFNLLNVENGEFVADTNAVKQVVAKVELFLKDISDSENSEEASEELDSEIEDEFILDIENRINSLEELLFDITPPEGDVETVRSVFREFHTLKGESAIVGLKDMSAFFHMIEDTIEHARHGQMVLTADVLDCLKNLVPSCKGMLRKENRRETTEEYYSPLLKKLAEASNAAHRDEAPQEEAEGEDDFFSFDESDDTAEEELSDNFEEPETEATPDFSDVESEDYNNETEPKITPQQSEETPVKGEELHSVSIDVRRLDKLLDLVGEVSLLGANIAQNENAAHIPGFSAELQELSRSCRTLHELTAGMRMCPIRPLFQRVRRAAYDAAQSVGKQVDISINGAGTEVDRIVIDQLTAASIHIIRNAIDHGIESIDERLQKGKPEHGRIKLSAYRNDSDVILEIADDGRGLDLDIIREKAIAIGMIKEHEKLDESQLTNLIFTSGLSTARNVTGLSGRGVGMDIVRQSIEDLRGNVEINTRKDKGTSIRIRFPVSLAAIEGLITKLGDNKIVLPINIIKETFNVTKEHISTVKGQGTVVTIRGVVVPVIFLGEELKIEHIATKPEDGVLIMVEDGESLAAILVDDVLETRQILIRQLEGDLSRVPTVSGAALMPDRSIGLVIEARRLLEKTSVRAKEAFARAGDMQVSSERKVDTVQIGSNQVGMIDFSVKSTSASGGELEHLLAINAFKAREFVPAEQLTPLPHAPKGFAGMLLLRNSTIPVVALSTLLGYVKEKERRPEWEQIIMVCEFSGKTVGFLVSKVNRVSYISWNDILPPPQTAGIARLEYIVGTILKSVIRDEITAAKAGRSSITNEDEVAFVLDFELIVQKVLALYDELGEGLTGVQRRKERNRILLAEDSALIRREVSNALRKVGIEVLEAENGQEALDIIQDLQAESEEKGDSIFNYVDLILSDIEMPKLDGYTLTTYIKKHPQLRVLPVLLHSSITNETIIRRAKEVKADGFIAKCESAELARQLKKYL